MENNLNLVSSKPGKTPSSTILCFAIIFMTCRIIGLHAEKILSQPRNVTKKEGESGDFTVTLDRAATGSKVTWYKDTILVDVNDSRITYDEDGRSNGQFTLRINPVIRSDKGYYVAAYAIGEILLSTKKAYLTVLEIPTKEYPICTTWKHIYNIMDIVNVTCISENISPQPHLQFERRATPSEIISNKTNIWISMEFRAVPNLNGQRYTCQQSGPNIQTIYCDVILNVSKTINVTTLREDDRQYDFGDKVKLTCIGNYSKRAKFSWEINGVQQDYDKSKVEIDITENIADGDNVTCTIQEGSRMGSSSITLRVNPNTPTSDDTGGGSKYYEISTTSKTITVLLSLILLVLIGILISLIIITGFLYKIYYCVKEHCKSSEPRTEEVVLIGGLVHEPQEETQMISHVQAT